jgi:PAS domain S-box-containing protein
VTGTVLILDDSLTVRMDLAEALALAGFEPRPCADAASAREILEREHIDLAILDVALPDADGIDFIREIRSRETDAAMPVLILSSESDIKDRIRGLQTGANEYIGKPYDLSYVIAKVRELLRAPEDDWSQVSSVLIIDDSATFREELRQACEDAGYQVLTAVDGDEGLRVAAARHPSAIVVDGVLPGIDGATVIRRIRLDVALRGVPCLLLTASGDHEAELRALDAGADAFVRKEEDVTVVLARLAAMLRRATSVVRPEETASVLSTKKILAVDDSQTFLQELAGSLRSEGYEVVLARSGEEALDLLAVEVVDCILLDVLMPGLSGQETCRRIKAAPSVRDVPLIMLTALDDRSAMIEALGAGADDYISKASDFEILTARVRAQLRRRQFEDENRRIREELLRKELEATDARAARELADVQAAAKAFLDSVVRNIPDTIFVKDAGTLCFEAVNPAGVALLGYAESELVGHDDRDFFPPEEAERRIAEDRAVLENGVIVDIEAETMRTRAHGERILHTKKIPIIDPDGRPRYLLGISEDITERHQAEDAVRQAMELAERANNAKSEFLSRMSHELRTPMNAVLGFAQLLELDDLTEQQRESVTQIMQGGRHLLELINEVLEITRIETGELSLSLEPVLLADVLTESLELVEPIAAAHHVTLPAVDRSDLWQHVRADRQRLKQVLINLLANAIKYNRENGAVTLSLGSTEAGRLRLSISDTGIGIPEDKMELLFEPFERLGAEQSSIEGTGLGLSLTRRLVQAMSGEIGFTSVSGEGSTFWVDFATADPGGAAVESTRENRAWANDDSVVSTVLLIEDNIANVRLVERILQLRPGVLLLTAMLGQVGLDLAASRMPDLILLDLHLPDMRGEAILDRVRNEQRTCEIPVVILSADASPGQLKHLLARGANGYLTKPFQVAEFLAMIDEHPRRGVDS